ncbi:LamG-like jellyroll fold domain-containing protein [Paractinoplanes abujensis]|uniref:RHS repeat-associated protein n=1 Tax=Paractinoplanes abujensis TaxID=882441 RepID=A0A7W7CN44_9ACTN|nr:LamG-like jellyroll fold domain-containing protein [Actinoplanes abujensis]MBB4690108.1 RHS repeat-associated protein [Actinoplanes abujensis]
MCLVLTVGLPPGAVPADGGFPLSGLLKWLEQPVALADVLGMPVQQTPAGPGDRGHYVSGDKTRANGGSGQPAGRGIGAVPASLPEPKQPGPWQAPPAAGADSFDEKTSKRVPERSGERFTEFKNADGSVTRRLYGSRVNYRDAEGRYQPIDTDLTRRAGRIETTANSITASLAPEGTDASLATLTTAAGDSMAYGVGGAVPAPVVIDGSVATYGEILSSTDIEAESLADGLRTTIVLKTPAAGNEWVLPLDLDGLAVSRGADGSITLADADGDVALRMAPGHLEDARIDPKSGAGAQSSAVTYDLTTVDGAPALKVTADPAWLTDPAREYPVRLGATVLTANARTDTFADSDATTTNRDTDDLPVGTWKDKATVSRSFVGFDAKAADGFGAKRVRAATLHLYHSWSADCGNRQPISVRRVTETFKGAAPADAGGLAAAPSYSAPIGTLRITDSELACANADADRAVGKWWSVPLAPGAVANWSAGQAADAGLALTTSESDTAAFKRFTSGNVEAGEFQPFVEVTAAANEPPQVNEQYPSYGQAVNTLTPELLADASDPDVGPKSLTYTFIVYANDAKTELFRSPVQKRKSWVIPSRTEIKWGESYYWSVLVDDGEGTNKDALFKNLFLTVVPQPAITSGLSQNSGRSFDPAIGNYTTTARDAAVTTIGPPLEITRYYNSSDPRTGQAFGAGWSSILDAKVVNRGKTAVVTYPDGRELAFGRDWELAIGSTTWTSPAGRGTVLRSITGGYQLWEKDGTQYEFLQNTSTGVRSLSGVKDVFGRELKLKWTGNQVTELESASGRKLYVEWKTELSPPRVKAVRTDVVNNAANTWAYNYTDAGGLISVCPPAADSKCHTYQHTDGSLYPTAVSNSQPSSYWRLNEAGGAVAASSVLENAGTDRGSYVDVNYSVDGPLAGTASRATGFNGASSKVVVPAKLAGDASNQAISMWFKADASTRARVLYGQSWQSNANDRTSSGYNPTLYIDKDGKLKGGFPTAPRTATGLGSLLHPETGKCVGVSGNSSVNGALLTLQSCTGAAAPNQQFNWSAKRQLYVTTGGTTKCLAPEGDATGKVYVVTETCSDSVAKQKWDVQANGQIVNDWSYQCFSRIDATSSSPEAIGQRACDKKVRALWQTYFPRSHEVVESSVNVANKQWHHVVLSAAGNEQTMFIDGERVGSLSGDVQDLNPVYSYLGAGFLGGGWPGNDTVDSLSNMGYLKHFAGSMAEVALYDGPVSEQTVKDLYAARAPVRQVSKVLRPSGGVAADVTYDRVSGRVSQVTDSNGATWQPQGPKLGGTTKLHESAVLAGVPSNYWRLNDTSGTIPFNEVNGTAARYSSVSLNTASGPFEPHGKAAAFNGTSSQLIVRRPGNIGVCAPNCPPDPIDMDTYAISMWFKTSVNGYPLFSYGIDPIAPGTVDYQVITPLYVDSDGRLRGRFPGGTDGGQPIRSEARVNDSKWHHVALVTWDDNQTLYLDGKAQGSLARGPWREGVATHMTVGAGYLGGGYTPGTHDSVRPTGRFFLGQIAEVALYDKPLDGKMVEAQFKARSAATSTAVPSVAYSVQHPDTDKVVVSTDVHELQGGRKLAEIDALGNTTRYGYNSKGNLRTVTDPMGNMTINEHDVRGNVVSTATCQDRSENKCSTSYFTYWPNSTDEKLSPRVMNDRLLTRRGPGSKSATDNTYRTIYEYNENTAARIAEIDPLGRRTTVTYSSSPPGLPTRIVKPGGGVVTIAYEADGDVREMTDPAGLKTRYTYDVLGRAIEESEYVGDTKRSTTTYVHDGQDRVVVETGAEVVNRVSGLSHTPVTTKVYNPDGLVSSETVSDASGGDAPRTVTYEYDQYGRRTTETDALGNKVKLGYDAYGRVNEQTHADDSVIRTTYDPLGHELKVEVPGEPRPVKEMRYDAAGRLASITDARGFLTAYRYTDNNLLTKVTRYNGASEETAAFLEEENAYDPAGNLVSQLTNNGKTRTTRTYDAAARGLTATLDPAGLNRTTTQTYSAGDDVLTTTLTQGATVVSRSEAFYDKLGRALAETTYTSADPLAPVFRWKFDSIFDRTTADSVGNSRGETTDQVGWSADHGGSAALTGSPAYVRSNQAVVDTARAYTAGIWVNVSDTSTSRGLLSMPSATGGTAMSLSHVTGGAWQLTMNGQTADGSPVTLTVRTANGTAKAGEWVHLAAGYDPATRKATLYVDGTVTGTPDTADAGFVPLPAAAVQAGDVSSSAAPLGKVDDVIVLQRALTETQVKTVRAGTDKALAARVVRTSQSLDPDGSVTSSTDPRGSTTLVENDAAGRPVVLRSPQVNTVTGEGQPVATIAVSMVGYNTFGELTEQQDPRGNKTVTRYDAGGRPIETESPGYRAPGSSMPVTAKTTNTFNAAGQVESTTDPLGATTRFKYDRFGRTTEVTAADGGVSSFKYTENGELLEQIDPTQAKAGATYDFMGRTVKSAQAVRQTGEANESQIHYLSTPWPDMVRTAAGVETWMEYNAAGEQTSVEDGAGNITRTEYDGAGRPTKVTAPDGTYETATYDLAGRLLESKAFSASGTPLRAVSSRFDAAGNLVEATDARGTTKTFAYDALGQLVSQTEPISGSDEIVSTFGYDVAGQRTRFTDGRGNRFVTTYNSWGLPESQIEPATDAHPGLADRTFTTIYDKGGRPVQVDSPGGVRVTSEYDEMGRLVRSSGTGAQVETADKSYEYDLTGRPTVMTGLAGTTTVAYDDRGLPTAIGGVSGTSSYTYNRDGALASRTDAAGTTSYTYDNAGRPDKVVNTGAGVDMKYAYDTMSQVSSIRYNTTGNIRSFGYDDLHRLTSDELKTAGGASVAKIAYGWDLNDNLKSKTTTGFAGATTNTYDYDLADRLILWDNGTKPVIYAFDKSGNRTQADGKTFAYDQRNQLTSSSDGTQYHYSPRGTLTSTVEGGLEQVTVTDAFNQVLSQSTPDGTTKTYTYDALGRLIKPGLTYTGLTNTVAGDSNATYVRDAGGGLVGVASGATKRYAWTDLHTDVVGEFAGDGTTLAASVAYDPWGKVLASGGMIGKLGFQSQWTDEGTGKVNMWARWYDPETGAFDTRDPASNDPTPGSGAANRFAYAEGDPLGNTDTTGYGVDGKCGTYDYECELKKYQAQLDQYHRDLDQHQRDVQFTGEEIARQQADYERGERESKTSLYDILIQVGVGMLLDMIGYNAVVGCLEGSVMDCIDLATNFLGPVKAFKMMRSLYKAIDRALNGYRMWRRIVDGARTLMNRASMLMNQARKHLSDLMQKVPKKPKPPKKKAKPPAKKKPKHKAKHRPKAKASEQTKPPKAKTSAKKTEKPDKERPDRPDRPEGSDRPSVSDQPADQRNFVKPDKGNDPQAAGEACHSFAPDTRVLMADGTMRPISEVNVGDKVVTTDPETGDNSDQQVTLLHANRDRDLTDVTVSSAPAPADRAVRTQGEGKGGRSTRGPTESTLETTANHPFWDATTGDWVDAAELTPGTSTLVGPNGEIQYVTKVHTFTGAEVMRDLTVDNIHTYYVIAGDEPILVHNCGNNPANHLGVSGKASFARIQAAVADIENWDVAQLLPYFTDGQLREGKKNAGKWRMFYGIAFESALAAHPLVANDPNITHLGNSRLGKRVPDFVIAVGSQSLNLDITGPAESTMRQHLNAVDDNGSRLYGGRRQILTYRSPSNSLLAEIFQ